MTAESNQTINSHLSNIYAKLKQHGLDSLLLSLPANISYLTDFPSRDSWLLLSKKQNYYLTDSRYTEEAKKRLDKNFQVKRTNGRLFSTVANLCQQLKLKNIGFEEKYLTFAAYHMLKEKIGSNRNLVPVYGLIEESREIKNETEISKIQKATEITIKALNIAKELIIPGKTELEIVGELERIIRYEGATDSSFEIIVASGPNSSYPHHKSSSRKIGNNEPVLIDIGVDYLGYKSDLTRVFFLGKINPLVRKVYDIVLKAQEKAISRIKPGVKSSFVDSAARNFIKKMKFGNHFSHNLGHGVGLEIHESPNISPREEKKLEEGLIFTIEPAIYLTGEFGIRIEDMVLVTKKGCVVLSGSLNK